MVNLAGLTAQLGELGTVGLLVALVILFVVAFKVLEMVFQTVLVAALSGGFYLALSYYLNLVSFSVNSLLFFAFLGGSLYTGYYLILQGYGLLSTIISIPVKLAGSLADTAKRAKKGLEKRREKSED